MRYVAPDSIKSASSLLAKEKGSAFVLAGGTDLLVRMKGGFVEPDLVVDVKRIKNMRTVKKTATGFQIGAAVSSAELGENVALRNAWPGVVEAANLIGSKQIQSRCTIVGNLCNASPAADSVPALVAAEAKAVISGPRGKRTIPVERVTTGPGKTSLGRGDIIETILLPKRPPRSGDAYLRFIPRTEMDIAVVSAGVNLTLDAKGTVKAARVALGAVAPTVVLVPEAAQDHHRHEARRGCLGAFWHCMLRRLPPHRRQARHPGFSYQGRSRDGQASCKNRVRTRRRQLMSGVHVSTTINGDRLDFVCEGDEPLLDVLRNRLGLTGAKEGCGTGDCGACSVMLDGRLVCSCLVLGVEAQDRAIETIEGMADGETLHPLQRKFIDHAALQCGICTPGILIAANALLRKNPDPSEEEIRFGLAGNLCRCTGYDKIVRAVQDAAKEMRGA